MKIALVPRQLYLLVILLLVGCVTNPSVGPAYYLLNSGADTSQLVKLPAFKLGLGPIELPSHLHREGILTYNSKNKLDYAEHHRWAEPLTENVLQVLRDNFTQLLPQQQVILFPYRQVDTPSYKIIIKVTKFGFQQGGQVIAKANWAIEDNKGKQLVANSSSLFRHGVENNYGTIVKIQSQLLVQLSVEIVTALAQELSPR